MRPASRTSSSASVSIISAPSLSNPSMPLHFGPRKLSPCLPKIFSQTRVGVCAVVIVDEAGQLSGRQLFDLIDLIRKRRGRLILSGDTRQHGPVEGSHALRAIERYSG